MEKVKRREDRINLAYKLTKVDDVDYFELSSMKKNGLELLGVVKDPHNFIIRKYHCRNSNEKIELLISEALKGNLEGISPDALYIAFPIINNVVDSHEDTATKNGLRVKVK